jgi:hypothetical protein
MKLLNKKGASFSGWVEGILLVILMVFIFGAITGTMNIYYGKDNQIGLVSNATEMAAGFSGFTNYSGDASDEIKKGEVLEVTEGFTLKSGWNLLKNLFSIILAFVTGSFIITAFGYLGVCSATGGTCLVGIVFQLIYIISIIVIILRALFKVKI